MTDAAGTAIAVLAALGAAGSFGVAAAVQLAGAVAAVAGITLRGRASGGQIRRPARAAVHTICTPAAPGLHPARLCWGAVPGRWPRRTNRIPAPPLRRARLPIPAHNAVAN